MIKPSHHYRSLAINVGAEVQDHIVTFFGDQLSDFIILVRKEAFADAEKQIKAHDARVRKINETEALK